MNSLRKFIEKNGWQWCETLCSDVTICKGCKKRKIKRARDIEMRKKR